MREHLQEVETPAGPQLNVYANRKGARFWALYVLVLEVGAILGIVWGNVIAPTEPMYFLFMTCCCILLVVLGWTLLYFGYWALTTQPLLLVNEIGITDNGSFVGFGMIRWEEVRVLVVYARSQRIGTTANTYLSTANTYLCIVPEHEHILVSRLSLWRKLVYHTLWMRRWGPSPVMIPHALLPLPPKDLCERIIRLDNAWPPLQRAPTAHSRAPAIWTRRDPRSS